MTQLTLFGSKGSGSAAVEMALRAADLEYRIVRASEWEADSAKDELQRFNPLGQIPTLVLPNGLVLTESAAILINLGLEYPGHYILPNQPMDRALAIRGLTFIAANCYSAVSVSDYPERWTTGKSKHAQACVRAAARIQLHRNWDIFFQTFAIALDADQDAPGALAFLTVVVSRWSGTRKHLEKGNAIATKILSRLESHPRIATVLAEHSAA